MKKINKEKYMEIENVLEYWSLYDIEYVEKYVEDDNDIYDYFWEMAESLTPIYTKDVYEAIRKHIEEIDETLDIIGYNTKFSLTQNLMEVLTYIYREKISEEYFNYIEDLFEDVKED